MTRFYLDTEFHDDGENLQLISLGVVTDNGHEFYAENADATPDRWSPWLHTNVAPHLRGGDAAAPHAEIGPALVQFVNDHAAGEPPEWWSWIVSHDWVLLCWLYGTMLDLPSGWPRRCLDLQGPLDRLGLSDADVPPPPDHRAHDALADARHHRAIGEWLAAMGELW